MFDDMLTLNTLPLKLILAASHQPEVYQFALNGHSAAYVGARLGHFGRGVNCIAHNASFRTAVFFFWFGARSLEFISPWL